MTTSTTVPPLRDAEPVSPGKRPAGGPAAGVLASVLRKSRLPLLLLVLAAIAVTAPVLVTPAAKSNVYLDPADSSATGARALADILAARGFTVTSVYRPADALAAVGAAHAGPPAVTLLITSPDLLTPAQRRQLARADADLVLVGAGAAALAALAPAVRVANARAPVGTAVGPRCGLTGAKLAGSANAGAITYRVPAGATGCYPVQGSPSVVRYAAAGRVITIIGNSYLVSDGLLAEQGNAALAINLLSGHAAIVWLTPEPTIATAPPSSATPRSGPSIVPAAAWLVVLQLCVALVLAALWRVRRLGPLITERLPVIVRASETVEGHARLYQSRRSRGQAAAALREAMLGRIRPALGLAPDAPAEAIVDALAGRSRRTGQDITALAYGPAPASDAELVRLAHDLDELEREVRSQ